VVTWSPIAGAVVLLMLGVPEAGTAEAGQDARERIRQSVETHCGRADAAARLAMAERIHVMLGTMPSDAHLQERSLTWIDGILRVATVLLPKDSDYRDLRGRHPELPELVLPDAFHVRAYALAERHLELSLPAATAFQSRPPATRESIATQIKALVAGAERAFLARAAGPTAEGLLRESLQRMLKDEFLAGTDHPFMGFLKPLDAAAFAGVQRSIEKAADAMPFLDLGGGGDPSRLREGAAVCRDPRRAGAVVKDALQSMYEITRAFHPAQFAVFDERKALVSEANAHWQKAQEEFGAPYFAIWHAAISSEATTKPPPEPTSGATGTSAASASNAPQRPPPAKRDYGPTSGGAPLMTGLGVLLLAGLLFAAWRWARTVETR
jgi:hypothetical protein